MDTEAQTQLTHTHQHKPLSEVWVKANRFGGRNSKPPAFAPFPIQAAFWAKLGKLINASAFVLGGCIKCNATFWPVCQFCTHLPITLLICVRYLLAPAVFAQMQLSFICLFTLAWQTEIKSTAATMAVEPQFQWLVKPIPTTMCADAANFRINKSFVC